MQVEFILGAGMFCEAIGRRRSIYPIKSCPSPLLAFQDGNLLHEFVGLSVWSNASVRTFCGNSSSCCVRNKYL